MIVSIISWISFHKLQSSVQLSQRKADKDGTSKERSRDKYDPLDWADVDPSPPGTPELNRFLLVLC